MTNNYITLAIPFYQDETFLKRTVESVLAQTIADWSLIISLDSKLSPKFVKYIDDLNDARIKVIHNKIENKGISGNWNNCIDAAKSDYVTILHSDDELLPNYIEIMQSLIKDEPNCAFYFCDAQVIDIDSKPVFSFVDKVKRVIQPKSQLIKLSGDKGLASLLRGCFIFCPTICYKTDIVKKYKFREQWKMVLDLDLYARLLIDGYTLVGTQKEGYCYRRHENNQTAKLTNDFKRFEEEVCLYQEVYQKVKLSWPVSANVARRMRIIKLHLLYLLVKSICTLSFSRTRALFVFYKSFT